MDVRDYLAVLRGRWHVIVACMLIALAAGAFVTVRAPKVYQARSTLFFSVRVGTSSAELNRGFSYAQALVNSYSQIAVQPDFLEGVVTGLKLDVPARQLARNVEASSPLDSVLLEVTVRDSSPARAARIADEVVEQLRQPATAVTVLGKDNVSANDVKLEPVSPAVVPTAAASPNVRRNLVVGLIIGLVAGVALAFLREAFDGRVRGRSDVALVTDLPVIGLISQPSAGDRLKRRLRLGGPSVEEQAKELRTNFQHLRLARWLRSVTFTSAHTSDATELTILNLGYELAQAGVQTLLVDADVRDPVLSLGFRAEGSAGLAEVLSEGIPWDSVVIHRSKRPLFLLPAGQALEDFSVSTDLEALQALIAELSDAYDVVLVKAPPALRAADALLLSRVTDGAVVVTDEPAMTRKLFVEELQSLQVAQAQMLGVVVVT